MWKFLSLLVVLCVCSLGHGAVNISVTGPGGSFTTPTENPPGSGLWEFSVLKVAVSGDASDTEFTVLTTSAADVLSKITIQSQAAGETLRLRLGTATTARVGPVGTLEFGSSSVDKLGLAEVQLFVAGNVNRIEGTKLMDSNITGNLLTGIKMFSRGALVPGRILELVVGGTIYGNIDVESDPALGSVLGGIARIQATRIGETDLPARIRARGIIGRIATGEMNSTNIEGAASPVPNDVNRGYVIGIGQINVGNEVAGSGDMNNVHIKTVQFYDGSANPGIFASGKFASGRILHGANFSMHASLPPLQPQMKFIDGVGGMITINSFATTENGQWTNGPILIGPDGPGQIVLTGTSHEYNTALIGGGVIGVAPFEVLAEEVTPPPTSELPSPRDIQLTLPFTGPVVLAPTAPVGTTPLIIRFARFPFDGNFYEFSSCLAQRIEGNRVIAEAAYLPPGGYAYRTQGDFVLELPDDPPKYDSWLHNLPDDVNAGPVQAFPCADSECETYFTVVDPCPGDFNNDGQRNTADLTRLLSRFGMSEPCGAPEDINVSFAVDTPDLTAFLAVFGTSCSGSRPGAPAAAPQSTITTLNESATTTRGTSVVRNAGSTTTTTSTTESNRPGEPAPMPPVLAALGFTSIESYTTYVEGLTEQQLSAHILQLLETIQMLENQTP